jgi:hypothetical protein
VSNCWFRVEFIPFHRGTVGLLQLQYMLHPKELRTQSTIWVTENEHDRSTRVRFPVCPEYGAAYNRHHISDRSDTCDVIVRADEALIHDRCVKFVELPYYSNAISVSSSEAFDDRIVRVISESWQTL